MYWPLGAPRIYSSSSSRKKRKEYTEGEDDEEETNGKDANILLGLRVSRSGHLFATISATTLTIWQTSPIVVLASVIRSPQSLSNYGPNVAVLLRPDSSIVVVQTMLRFLVTYTINTDPNSRVYQQHRVYEHAHRQSITERSIAEEERAGFPEVNVRFRMVIKIDAGIGKALALDDELVVATEKPAAVQCIRWTPDNTRKQTSTELLSRMPWMPKKTSVVDMIYDRALSLAIWITGDGSAYAIQRLSGSPKELDATNRLFRGYGFHTPTERDDTATRAAINARFSLLAVGCASGEVHVYTARDYVGSIPLSHKLQPPESLSTTGSITFLSYSPDGYCLFVGYKRGWVVWSVYGKHGGSSFTSDRVISEANEEGWLNGVSDGSWLNGGSNILLTSHDDDRIWVLEMARSAVTGCLNAANVSRTLLLTTSGFMVYRGYDLPTLTSISSDSSLWQQVQIPSTYLTSQQPLRCAVTSADGRYVAVAGRRGLAHYSVSSGRWKTFDDPVAENAFIIRGGMCWYQHILVAAVETSEHHELRLYSRELGLDDTSMVYTERLPAPTVVISLSGQDSLLVYTYENILYHFVVNVSSAAVTLVQVGQIALHGIVRAPARVRAVSWILPEHQLRNGDPSQDVAHASVLFLVDAKLVLLQASTHEDAGLKYDMRVIANNVEYFDLMRDHLPLLNSPDQSLPESPSPDSHDDTFHADRGLTDSLWFYDGNNMQCWANIEDLLEAASMEMGSDSSPPVRITTDFYPSSVILDRGLILGVEPNLVQRRDVQFAYFRFAVRTQLFLPSILRRHLSLSDSPAALRLSRRYQELPYFSHALEILLHQVLDDEVDKAPSSEDAFLPSVLSFLSSFPDYLDILVQCTRKTEVRSWQTLFAYLPPPQELFEASLQKGLLKTAGGYLLVLHTFQELETSSEQCVRLLQRAKEANDWDLCKELARFLMALDQSGDTLRQALRRIDIRSGPEFVPNGSSSTEDIWLRTPQPNGSGTQKNVNSVIDSSPSGASNSSRSPRNSVISEEGTEGSEDYFSPRSE